MHDSVAPPLASTSALPRTLGLGALWLLIVNGMIGAGIFGIPAEAARLAGAFSPLLFLLTAVLIAPVMLCFAELASATRESGGPARYVRVAFGPMAGFQTGWALYVARLTALAANFNLLVSALAHFWPGLGEGLPRVLMLAALSALLALLNIVGVRAAVRSIGVLTAGKLFPIALLALLGVWQWAQIDGQGRIFHSHNRHGICFAGNQSLPTHYTEMSAPWRCNAPFPSSSPTLLRRT